MHIPSGASQTLEVLDFEQALALSGQLPGLPGVLDRCEAYYDRFCAGVADIPGIRVQKHGRLATRQGYYGFGIMFDGEPWLQVEPTRIWAAIEAEGVPFEFNYGPVYRHRLFNLAAEEYVLKHFEEDVFMLWRNDKSIIIGKYQNTAAEINADYVKEHHIKVVRRMTGGGAVFHDLGNVNYTFIGNKGSGDFRTFSEPILRVMNEMGVPAKFEGRNDLTINGMKFSGTAQCIYKNRVLHHGTLLFSAEMSDLTAALKVNPLKFTDKAVKSVRKRVTNISEHLPKPMTVTDFIDTVMQHIRENSENAVMYDFSDEDLQAINQLRDKKYSTWEWNFGTSPKFAYSKLMRTSGGNVELNLNVEKGLITGIKFYGDFFSQKEPSEFEQFILQKKYESETIRQILEKVELNDYFRNVTIEEMMALFFQ